VTGGALRVSFVPKPWGRRHLPPPYGMQDTEIGEIHFQAPGALQTILGKYLFTSDTLSIQLHPTEQTCPKNAGKDECWMVTDADDTARVAIGFRKPFSELEIREAAMQGLLEDLLQWHSVKKNDFIFVPSGTVHAIGAGVTLVELQQNVDTTYRLYDHGRGRQLQLEQALRSLADQPSAESFQLAVSPEEEQILLESRHFQVAQSVGQPGRKILERFASAVQVLPLSGPCRIGEIGIYPGSAGWAHDLRSIDLKDCERALLFAAV